MAGAKAVGDVAAAEGVAPKKRGGAKLLLILLVVFGGIGAGAGYMGLLKMPGAKDHGADAEQNMSDVSKTVFLDLPKVIVPLGDQAAAKHLAAEFVIETTREHAERIEKLKPRLMDMLNTYLRAVDEKELTDPSRFRQLQAQMLRRSKLIAGEVAVKNLLIQEFILQ